MNGKHHVLDVQTLFRNMLKFEIWIKAHTGGVFLNIHRGYL